MGLFKDIILSFKYGPNRCCNDPDIIVVKKYYWNDIINIYCKDQGIDRCNLPYREYMDVIGDIRLEASSSVDINRLSIEHKRGETFIFYKWEWSVCKDTACISCGTCNKETSEYIKLFSDTIEEAKEKHKIYSDKVLREEKVEADRFKIANDICNTE